MASNKQLQANKLNAQRSTGPRTEEGKKLSRLNAVRHGLTATTVIGALEDAADYEAFEQDIAADYGIVSATDRELVARLASVLWRLRRSTSIETGLLQVQAELMQSRKSNVRPNVRQPEWYDELDVAARALETGERRGEEIGNGDPASDTPQEIAYCFLQAGRLQFGVIDTLTRYETALWRQAAQLLLLLQSRARR
jgi:hypothetical protein